MPYVKAMATLERIMQEDVGDVMKSPRAVGTDGRMEVDGPVGWVGFRGLSPLFSIGDFIHLLTRFLLPCEFTRGE